MSTETYILRPVDSLSMPERVAVSAARSYRALREHPRGHCCCLRQIFQAANLLPALPTFIHFQNALSADPLQNMVYEDYSAAFLGESEARLLCALAHWQYRPHEDPQESLPFIQAATVRRIAACAGHRFAIEMAAAGLWLPTPRARLSLPNSNEPVAGEDFEYGFMRLH